MPIPVRTVNKGGMLVTQSTRGIPAQIVDDNNFVGMTVTIVRDWGIPMNLFPSGGVIIPTNSYVDDDYVANGYVE